MTKRFNFTSKFLYSILLSLLLSQNFPSSNARHRENKVVKVAPYIIDYGNGTIIRDPVAAPSFSPPPKDDKVQAKDITITGSLRARIIIPARPDPSRKMPILLYFHGGAFCIGSAFGWGDTTYLARVSAQANVVALSIEYRLFPEHTVPAPYDDAWTALEWIAAHAGGGRAGLEPWVTQNGDLQRVFVGGDSAGGNIAHNVASRAKHQQLPNSVTLSGVFLAMPFFLGSKRVSLEPATIIYSPNYRVWPYVCGKCKDGVDDGYINPFGPDGSRVPQIGCKKVLVYTAEIDELRGRGRWYYEKLKTGGWKDQAQWVEAQGQEHIFHISKPQDPATTKLITEFSSFLNT